MLVAQHSWCFVSVLRDSDEKGGTPTVGARRRTPHRGDTHYEGLTPYPSNPTPRKKSKTSSPHLRAALRPWATGIGLTVLVAVAAVVVYRLAAGIDFWTEPPTATATPTVYPHEFGSASIAP